MIQRSSAICKSCDNNFILRVVVPLAPSERICFACPGCHVRLTGRLELDYSVPSMQIDPYGFKISQSKEDDQGEVVTISSDLPVHRIKHVNKLDKGGSPFLWMCKEMGNEAFIEWKNRVEYLQTIRQNKLESIHAVVHHAELENWAKVGTLLEQKGLWDVPDTSSETIMRSFYMTLSALYHPLMDSKKMEAISEEFLDYCRKCQQIKPSEYEALLTDYCNKYGYLDYRSKLFGLFIRILEHYDAFMTGLLYEYMPDKLRKDISSYRIYRADFDMVKSTYQDIFELIVKSLEYVGPIVNLIKRNEAYHFSIGCRTMNSFQRKKAFKKLEILSDIPEVESLISGVSRNIRNDIGHFSIRYDYRTGNVIDDDSQERNYIEFLGDFLVAVRVLWFLLIAGQQIDLDRIE